MAVAGPGAFKHGPAYRRVMLGCATRAVAWHQASRRWVEFITPCWIVMRGGLQRRARCPLGGVLRTVGGSPSAGLPLALMVGWSGGLAGKPASFG